MAEKIRIKSTKELTSIQKLVAAKMTKSATTVPQLYQNIKVDTTHLLEFKESLKEKILLSDGIKITYTDLLIKITASTLREYIEINSFFDNGKHIIYEDINIGLAISVGNDLLVATIYNADELDIGDIARRRIEIVEKAANHKLSLEDVRNSTITLTNVGMFGIRSTYAIINPPQAAILAVGEIYREPAIIEEKVIPRSFIEFGFSVDHRIVNGVLSAKFLQKLAYVIEKPQEFLK